MFNITSVAKTSPSPTLSRLCGNQISKLEKYSLRMRSDSHGQGFIPINASLKAAVHPHKNVTLLVFEETSDDWYGSLDLVVDKTCAPDF